MTTGLNFWDLSIWEFILILCGIFLCMILSNILIKLIKPLRKALIPSPVLGGFIFLIAFTILKKILPESSKEGIENAVSSLEILTYHGLGLGFVASALKIKSEKEAASLKGSQKDIVNSSLITVSTYILQGIVGIIISVSLFFLVGSWPASGLLLPMGFGQGPGQAFNWGNIYSQYTEAISDFGAFQDGASFGLSIAAMGFIASSFGGILYLNIQRKKGNAKMTSKAEHLYLEPTVETFTDQNEIPASDSIDKASIQLGIVFLLYGVSYLIILGISKLCDLSGVGFLTGTVKPLFWGFNFIMGTGVAAIFKIIMKKLKKKKIIKRQYTNNYMLDRISGCFFDVMVVAAIGAIDLSAFTNMEFILPLILMCVMGTITSYLYVKHTCNILFPTYKEESFLCMYGMLTGTASTGIILLREIDPEYKTKAANNMVYQTLYSVIFGAPVLLAMGSAAKSFKMLIIWSIIFVVYFLAIYLVIRRSDFKKHREMKKKEKNGNPAS